MEGGAPASRGLTHTASLSRPQSYAQSFPLALGMSTRKCLSFPPLLCPLLRRLLLKGQLCPSRVCDSRGLVPSLRRCFWWRKWAGLSVPLTAVRPVHPDRTATTDITSVADASHVLVNRCHELGEGRQHPKARGRDRQMPRRRSHSVFLPCDELLCSGEPGGLGRDARAALGSTSCEFCSAVSRRRD